VAPQLLARCQSLRQAVSGRGVRGPVVFQFGSWIGGDRDGNPYVTSEVTQGALRATRLASLRRYRSRLLDLVRNLSIEDQALQLPSRSSARSHGRSIPCLRAVRPRRATAASFSVSRGLHDGEARPHHCPRRIRQFAADRSAPQESGYPNADRLIEDIDLMRGALEAAGARRLSDALLLPLRREVGIFRFSTVRLDVREQHARESDARRHVSCPPWRRRAAADDSNNGKRG